jgi:hypothetical protein
LRSDRVAPRHTSGMLPLLSNLFSGCRGGCRGGIFQPRSVRPGSRAHPLWVVWWALSDKDGARPQQNHCNFA